LILEAIQTNDSFDYLEKRNQAFKCMQAKADLYISLIGFINKNFHEGMRFDEFIQSLIKTIDLIGILIEKNYGKERASDQFSKFWSRPNFNDQENSELKIVANLVPKLDKEFQKKFYNWFEDYLAQKRIFVWEIIELKNFVFKYLNEDPMFGIHYLR